MTSRITWLFVSLLLFSNASIFAAEPTSPLNITRPAVKLRIRNLTFNAETITVVREEENDNTLLYAKFEGHYQRPDSDWHLLLGTKEIPIGKTGKLELKIPLTGVNTEVVARTINPLGEVEKEVFNLIFPKWVSVSKTSPHPGAGRKSLSVTPSLGSTLITYNQTGHQTFSGSALTAKLSTSYAFKESRWEAGASAFFTALPLSSNWTGVQVQYLGVNLRGGYVLPWLSDPWKLSFMAGAYYSTMFVTSDTFGYSNVSGPQIYPSLHHRFGNGSTLSLYLKYSPISNALTFLTLNNREIAAGINWNFIVQRTHQVSLSLDLADLSLVTNSGRQVQSSTTTLGVGYSI